MPVRLYYPGSLGFAPLSQNTRHFARTAGRIVDRPDPYVSADNPLGRRARLPRQLVILLNKTGNPPQSDAMATPADQYGHPQPQPPQQQQQHQPQRQQQRPQLHSQSSHQRHSSQAKPRSFSFRSDRSHHSGGGGGGGSKPNFYETHEEKESRRLHSKADPSLAINEAEPCKSLLFAFPIDSQLLSYLWLLLRHSAN